MGNYHRHDLNLRKWHTEKHHQRLTGMEEIPLKEAHRCGGDTLEIA